MDVYDLERDLVCSHEKLVGYCAGCGEMRLKKSMVTISAKHRYNAKTIMHLCVDCYVKLCEHYGIVEK